MRQNDKATEAAEEARLESPSDADIKSLVAAHYAVDEGLSYERIAELMNQSRATIARRLQHAVEQGWVEKRTQLIVPASLRPAYDAMTGNVDLQEQILARLGSRGLRRVSVVHDWEVADDIDEHRVIKRIGHAAAVRITECLTGKTSSQTVGMNWGWSVFFTVEALRRVARRRKNLKFVPLMGNFAVDEGSGARYDESQQCSANRLARRAAEAFSADPPRRVTVPAAIPGAFARDKDRLNAIWEFLEHDPSYKQVFGAGHHYTPPGTQPKRGESGGLIHDLDAIITGMSGLQVSSTLIAISKVVDSGEIARLNKAGYVGDLGGVPIHDPDSKITDQNAEDIAERVRRLVVGPTVDDFKRVAEKAQMTGDPGCGVFMIGRGKGKARAFIAACRLGAVTELFTDVQTATEMVRILGKERR